MREKVIEIFAKVANVDEREVSESTPLRNSTFKNNANSLGLDFILMKPWLLAFWKGRLT